MRSRLTSVPVETEEQEINVTPMLDVVFIMLIFFIVTASFVREAGIEVNKPDSTTSTTQDKASIVVAIDAEGTIWLERRPIDPRAVRAHLERLHAENPKGTIVIQAGRRGPHPRARAGHGRGTAGGDPGHRHRRPEGGLMNGPARLALGLVLAMGATAVIVISMERMVAAPRAELAEVTARRYVDFVQPETQETDVTRRRREAPPPSAPPPPAPVPTNELGATEIAEAPIEILAPVAPDLSIEGPEPGRERRRVPSHRARGPGVPGRRPRPWDRGILRGGVHRDPDGIGREPAGGRGRSEAYLRPGVDRCRAEVQVPAADRRRSGHCGRERAAASAIRAGGLNVRAIAISIGLTVLVAASSWAQSAPTMSEQVYNSLGRAQQKAEEGKMDEALSDLDGLARRRDLSGYERAQVLTTRGYILSLSDDVAASLASYADILEIDGVPERFMADTRYRLAQLELRRSEYAAAVGHLDGWMGLVDEPGPDGLSLLAFARFQSGDARGAMAPAQQAIDLARARDRVPAESWYQILIAAADSIDDLTTLRSALEAAVAHYPRKSYWMHLAAVFARLDDPAGRAAAYSLAYDSGLLSGVEITNLVQLLLQADNPERAVRILGKELEAGTVDGSAETLLLLARGHLLARQESEACATFARAYEIDADVETALALARCQSAIGRWADALATSRRAVGSAGSRAGEFHLTAGIALAELDREDEALEALRTARADSRVHDAARRWIAHLEAKRDRRALLDAP